MKNNPKMNIKCTFSNKVHKLLEPNLNVKASSRWQHKVKLTDADKIKLFDEIYQLHKETSAELRSYLIEKSYKKKIEKARVERGCVKKKKTSKEEFLMMNK